MGRLPAVTEESVTMSYEGIGCFVLIYFILAGGLHFPKNAQAATGQKCCKKGTLDMAVRHYQPPRFDPRKSWQMRHYSGDRNLSGSAEIGRDIDAAKVPDLPKRCQDLPRLA